MEWPTGKDVGREIGVRQDHPAEPDHRRAALFDHGLAHVGKPVLEVGVARPDDREEWVASGDLRGGGELAGHAHEWVFGWLVAVRWWEVGGPLHMRVVVRTPGGDAHQSDAELGDGVEEGVRLREVDAEPRAVATKRVRVRAGVRFGLSGALGVCYEWDQVERGEPHRDREVWSAIADAGNDGAKKIHAVFQIAAEAAGATVSAEEFVQEVAVAVFHVDEVEPRLMSEHGSIDVSHHEFVEFVVAENCRLRRADAFVEDRMFVRRPWRGYAVGAGPAAGMCELQARDLVGCEQRAQCGELVDG